MQRMDLVRLILLRLEKPDYVATGLTEEFFTARQICYHVWMLNDAGFLLMDTQRLSDAGQQFCNMWRGEKTWKIAKRHLIATVGSVTGEGLAATGPLLMDALADGRITV
jgi:hypothetical protein